MPTSETVRTRSGSDVGLIRLRDATPNDLSAMARMHRRVYSRDHFLALLPEAELANYYGRFLGGGSRVILAIGEGDQLLGFAVYGRNIEPRIAEFKRDRRGAIWLTAIRHPVAAARRVLASLRDMLRGGTKRVDAPAALLSIAVAEGGKGVGRCLLEDMLRRSAEAGESRLGLWVRHGNVAALNAYIRVGFRVVVSTMDQYYMERSLAHASTTDDRDHE